MRPSRWASQRERTRKNLDLRSRHMAGSSTITCKVQLRSLAALGHQGSDIARDMVGLLTQFRFDTYIRNRDQKKSWHVDEHVNLSDR